VVPQIESRVGLLSESLARASTNTISTSRLTAWARAQEAMIAGNSIRRNTGLQTRVSRRSFHADEKEASK
jgi:hypothetical protein